MSGEGFEMSQTHAAAAPVKGFDNFEHGFPAGFGPGGWGHIAYAIGIAFAVFQSRTTSAADTGVQIMRSMKDGDARFSAAPTIMSPAVPYITRRFRAGGSRDVPAAAASRT